MEGEEDQEMKHVCKLCSKRYPCGKSLGGHMRSHMIGNSNEAEEREKISALGGGRSCKMESGFEGGSGHSGYGLRENPKKTWRLANSRSASLQENVCKECGKVFHSLKALCGHMACHSEKERVSGNLEDHSWSNASPKPVMDRRKRSKRTRYRTLAAYPPSSVSEIEQEQQELAMCLMMLSRDSTHWGGLNSLVDSSDNNSVVLEAKSSSIDMRISAGEVMNCVSNGDEIVEMKKLGNGKSKSAVSDSQGDEFGNSDSGYFINGAQRAESAVSVDGSFRNGRPQEWGSGFHVFDAESMKTELGNDLKKLICKKTELGKGLIKQEGYEYDQVDSRKRAKNHSFSKEKDNNPPKAPKRSKYECLTCNNTFHSHHALGGHRANHKRVVDGCNSSNCDSIQNSTETDTWPNPIPDTKLVEFCSGKPPISHHSSLKAEKKFRPRKSNGHQCPICFRVFKSGQALGGHKKSHFVGVTEDKSNRTLLMKKEPLEIPGLIDLNLPASIEEDANGHV